MPETDRQMKERQRRLSLFAKALPEDLAGLFPDLPDHQRLRGPETGSVMVQGRSGGSGAPFSLGEVTVTRASLRLPCGTVGHAMVMGRAKDHALRVAALDALFQTPAAAELGPRLLAPLEAAAAERSRIRAEKAAATRVEFFTLQRGEDA